jgi:hypothetical protein
MSNLKSDVHTYIYIIRLHFGEKRGEMSDFTHNVSSCLLFKTWRFGDWILSPYQMNLLIWAQWIELVPLSSHLFAQSEYVPPEDGDRIQSPKRHVLNKIEDDG